MSFIPQNWQGYLSSEVDRALSQGVIPIELAQEKVMLALTLTLVKGVCELVPSLTRSLFDTMMQYISHRRPRWLLSCRIRGNHPTPLEGRRSKRQTAIVLLWTTPLSRDGCLSRSENSWKSESCASTRHLSWFVKINIFVIFIIPYCLLYFFILYLYLKSMSCHNLRSSMFKINLNKNVCLH